MKRRILSIFLSVCLLLSVGAGVLATDTAATVSVSAANNDTVWYQLWDSFKNGDFDYLLQDNSSAVGTTNTVSGSADAASALSGTLYGVTPVSTVGTTSTLAPDISGITAAVTGAAAGTMPALGTLFAALSVARVAGLYQAASSARLANAVNATVGTAVVASTVGTAVSISGSCIPTMLGNMLVNTTAADTTSTVGTVSGSSTAAQAASANISGALIPTANTTTTDGTTTANTISGSSTATQAASANISGALIPTYDTSANTTTETTNGSSSLNNSTALTNISGSYDPAVLAALLGASTTISGQNVLTSQNTTNDSTISISGQNVPTTFKTTSVFKPTYYLNNANMMLWNWNLFGVQWSDGNYILQDDVQLYKSITVTGDATLYLNGYDIEASGSGATITVAEGGSLTVYDTSLMQDGEIDLDAATLTNNGTVTLYSGTIRGADGVLNNNLLNVYGGKIVGTRYGINNAAGTLTLAGMPVIDGGTADIFLGTAAPITIGMTGLWNTTPYSVASAAQSVDGLGIQISTPTAKDYSDHFTSAIDSYEVTAADINGQKVLLYGPKGSLPAQSDDDDDDDDAVFPFTDVTPNDWFYQDVAYAYFNGLMNGTGATTFSPYVPLNRGMMVTILYRLEKEPTVNIYSRFTDVASGTWYDSAVAWGSQNGIVLGYGDGTYGPTRAVTREQMCAILYRYASYKGIDTTVSNDALSAYIDASNISPYAVSAVNWAVSNGFLFGSASMLNPRSAASRADVAILFSRFLQTYAVIQ